MTRAIFVLTSSDAAEQFLRIVPDMRGLGLTEVTLLHLMSAHPGPAEPMPELANWVRHFETALPRVELALKRGDPVKWIYELARVRNADVVVISGIPNGTEWDFERVSSPLRALGIPILFLPDQPLEAGITDQVILAVKSADTFQSAVTELSDWFKPEQLQAVCVSRSNGETNEYECSGVWLQVVPPEGDVVTTVLKQVDRCQGSLLTILAEEETGQSPGIPVVKPLLESTLRPILIWPSKSKKR